MKGFVLGWHAGMPWVRVIPLAFLSERTTQSHHPVRDDKSSAIVNQLKIDMIVNLTLVPNNNPNDDSSSPSSATIQSYDTPIPGYTFHLDGRFIVTNSIGPEQTFIVHPNWRPREKNSSEFADHRFVPNFTRVAFTPLREWMRPQQAWICYCFDRVKIGEPLLAVKSVLGQVFCVVRGIYVVREVGQGQRCGSGAEYSVRNSVSASRGGLGEDDFVDFQIDRGEAVISFKR